MDTPWFSAFSSGHIRTSGHGQIRSFRSDSRAKTYPDSGGCFVSCSLQQTPPEGLFEGQRSVQGSFADVKSNL